ncbi:MAG: haloacid dehalogenase, partial [Dehalococcoidia bacterium]|nr:haloacid dehalogenase [Dehalococcoidia bacterium]
MRKKKLPTASLERIAEEARKAFSVKDIAREQALRLCREVIRNSANTIRAVHRREMMDAGRTLDSGRALLTEVSLTLAEHSDLSHAGLVHDAQKEFAEASITLALVGGKTLPSPAELKVNHSAYLNGLGEAAGEMRRYLLDTLRSDELARCEEILDMMDDIY